MNVAFNPNYTSLNKTPQRSLRKSYSNQNTPNPQNLVFGAKLSNSSAKSILLVYYASFLVICAVAIPFLCVELKKEQKELAQINDKLSKIQAKLGKKDTPAPFKNYTGKLAPELKKTLKKVK